MIPPQVGRDGKKTIFANLHDMCRRMHRSMDHVIMYLFAELGTQGSVDGSQRLIIKGKFTQKQIETMMRGYISRFYVLKLLNGVVEYVTCKTCRSGETSLHKENRLTFLKCEVCGSNRTVAAIKSGFRVRFLLAGCFLIHSFSRPKQKNVEPTNKSASFLHRSNDKDIPETKQKLASHLDEVQLYN